MLKRAITEDEIRTYDRDGIVCLRGLFDADVVDGLREAAEECMAADPSDLTMEIADMQGKDGRFFFDTFLWLRNAKCRNFVHHSAAAEIAGRVMGAGKANIFFDQWLIKEPGTLIETPWHHDCRTGRSWETTSVPCGWPWTRSPRTAGPWNTSRAPTAGDSA